MRPGPPSWGLDVGLTAPPCKNPVIRKFKEGYGPYRAVMPMMIFLLAFASYRVFVVGKHY
jgi:hypothetical protein